MFEPLQLINIAIIFVLGGLVKGISGLGLPTICLVLLTFFLDLKLAIIIVAGPALLTNIWQALSGHNFWKIWKRLWSYFLFAVTMVWLGTQVFFNLHEQFTIILLGLIVIIYAFFGLLGLRLQIDQKNERWLTPFIGGVNGVITGMTGTFMIPSVIYFQAIGLQKRILVQTLGILFSLFSLTLIVLFYQRDIRILDHGGAVVFATTSAFTGLYLGQKIRRHLPENIFRKVLFAILLALGILLIVKAAIY